MPVARAIILTLLLLLTCGCRNNNADVATARVADRVSQPARGDAAPPALQAMFGSWQSSVQATLELSMDAPRSWRDAIADDLEQYPIQLRLTGVDYISRTSVKTIHDRYRLIEVAGDNVIIELISGFGLEPRRTALQLRDGFLTIRIGEDRVIAFERITP